MSEMEKITGDSPEAKSLDITQQNIEQLRQLFPDVFSENKIDVHALTAQLIESGGEVISPEEERYNFTWNGKTKARQIAQTPSTGTLRPSKEESINWDSAENLFIEGDNLEVLKLLQKSYHKKVKMIYIDPPYNTGKDFVYKDNFHDNVQNYLEQTGQLDNEGNKLSTNLNTSGRFHSHWLNMIFPRLKLARNLLSDDGVIFISIDENEYSNLETLCKEVFGEDNFIGELIWIKKFSPQNDANYFSLNHESILCFAKSKASFKRNLLPMTEEQLGRYTNLDNDSRGVWQSDNLTVATYSESYDYPITTPSGRVVNPAEGRCWAVPKSGFDTLVSENRIWFGKDGGNVPRLKRFLSETQQGRVPISILHYDEVGHTQSASQELKKLFGNKKYFDFPKPVRLIEHLMSIATDKDDIVLDFFAGSGTTGHALLNKNKEDGGNRKFILVQLPEPISEKSDAYKDGFKVISDITIKRISKVENISFKKFTLDETNIRPWDADFDNLEQVLREATESIKSDRSNEDVLYEILLKYGIELTVPVETEVVNGKQVFVVGAGALIVCLDDGITSEVVEGIAKLKDKLDPETAQVVFKDAGFADSNVKTNAIQILKQAGIDDVKSI